MSHINAGDLECLERRLVDLLPGDMRKSKEVSDPDPVEHIPDSDAIELDEDDAPEVLEALEQAAEVVQDGQDVR